MGPNPDAGSLGISMGREMLAPFLSSPLEGLGWKWVRAAPLISYLFCRKVKMETVSLLEIPLGEITRYFTECLDTGPESTGLCSQTHLIRSLANGKGIHTWYILVGCAKARQEKK